MAIRIKAAEGVYYPREDSHLLAEAVEKYSFGDVLDLGTGSGIQGITASLNGCRVIFADIDEAALDSARENARLNGVEGGFVPSDMFSDIKGKFDTIVFNPPYLPQAEANGETALDGGIHGRKYIDIFLSEYKDHLNKGGIALLVESSFNGYESDAGSYGAEVVGKTHYFFEDLVVLLLR
jgi:release factor glutamine methyltransferase